MPGVSVAYQPRSTAKGLRELPGSTRGQPDPGVQVSTIDRRGCIVQVTSPTDIDAKELLTLVIVVAVIFGAFESANRPDTAGSRILERSRFPRRVPLGAARA